MTLLSDRALLVQLSISQWQARKYDKRVSQQVAAINHASNSAGRYNKSLLPMNDYLDNVHGKSALIRKDFYTNTLPWAMEGAQLLPSTNYLAFMTEFRKAKGEWETLVSTFVAAYPTLKADAAKALGDMYSDADYPSENDIAGKFKMDLAVFPVPSNDFRVSLGSDEMSRIQKDIQERLAQAQALAAKDVWKRLYDRVEHISRQCGNPSARIHDSLVGHARELCDLLPRLNITDDPNLESMRQEVEQRLASYHPDALRNDPGIRQEVAESAEDIMKKMSVFMNGL